MIFVKEKGAQEYTAYKKIAAERLPAAILFSQHGKNRSYLGVFCDDRADDGTRNCSGIDAALRVSAPAAAITALPIAAISIPAFTLVFTIPARAHNPDRGGTPGRPSSHDPGAQA